MRITVDTNVLVRSCVRDDLAQASIAAKVLTDAVLIAIALTCLCEFVWVLRRVYNIETDDVIRAIRALMALRPDQARVVGAAPHQVDAFIAEVKPLAKKHRGAADYQPGRLL